MSHEEKSCNFGMDIDVAIAFNETRDKIFGGRRSWVTSGSPREPYAVLVIKTRVSYKQVLYFLYYLSSLKQDL